MLTMMMGYWSWLSLCWIRMVEQTFDLLLIFSQLVFNFFN